MGRKSTSQNGTGLEQARLHYDLRGTEGPRVLLLHAIGFDHRTWESILPYLEDRYRILAVDLPGHGASDKPGTVDYGPWSLAARVLRLLEELGWKEAALVGNSLGGGVSLALAEQAPDRVRALALLNSVAFRRGLPPVGLLASLPLVPVLSGYAPGVAVRLGLESCRSGWGSVTADRCAASREYLRSAEGRLAFFRALRHLYGPDLDRMAERYPEIRCPALVLHGQKDPLIRSRHAEQLARTLPRAELLRLPRCGHFPQEECPQDVGPALRRFLDRTAGHV